MRQVFRTTLRLDLDKPASAQAASLLHQLHTERSLSYSALIVPAINAYYHLHVVYVPVVEKQVLWSKRCKDPLLIGTVKETIMQVSHSKKWQS